MLSAELREKAESLVARYPVGRSALLPLLHLVQAQDGYISDDGIAECAELLSLTKAEVGAVATFYTMYKREPLGRHLVSVCTNFSCKVRGAKEVYDLLSERLGVGHNGTTPDGAVTLEHAECLGNCEGAPVVTVDYLNYECQTPQMALELVERLIAGEVPPPTRGFASPGIREMEHRLAGLGPLRARDGELSVVSTSDAPPPPGDQGRDPLHGGPDLQLSGQGGDAAGAGTPPRAAQEDAVEREVADTGVSPREVEQESGYTGREMPTSDPDSDASEPSSPDPRTDDLEPDQPPGDRDRSRYLTDDGIADTPQSEELGAKNPPDDPGPDGTAPMAGSGGQGGVRPQDDMERNDRG
jgi:NADH-quinone oxidoreductase subunit E